MSHHPDLSVSLDQLLLRKEVRVRQQGEWLKRHSLPLVSFTVNMPGAVKLNAASQTVMDAGMRAIQELCQKRAGGKWLVSCWWKKPDRKPLW